MLMILILGGFALSSLALSGDPREDTSDETREEEDDTDDGSSQTGNLMDWDTDLGEDSDVQEGSERDVNGTANGDEFSIVGRGTVGTATLDRGVFSTSESWDSVVDSFAGEDTIVVESGHFLLYGGEDDDQISAESASGLVFGGGGSDIISLSGMSWLASGEGGDDTFSGGENADVLIGGEGADSISGGEGDDLLIGHGLWYSDPTTGAVQISDILSIFSDTLVGGDGNDTLIATAGDVVSTGAGQDVVLGYMSLGQDPININVTDSEDTFTLEIIVTEDFDTSLLDESTEIQNHDGIITVYLAGYPIIHFSGEANVVLPNLDIRVSFHDADDRYLG